MSCSATTLGTALMIDNICKGVTRPPQRTENAESAHAQVHGGIPAPSILVQVEERDRKFATKTIRNPGRRAG
jgi:hypothetical protein